MEKHNRENNWKQERSLPKIYKDEIKKKELWNLEDK